MDFIEEATTIVEIIFGYEYNVDSRQDGNEFNFYITDKKRQKCMEIEYTIEPSGKRVINIEGIYKCRNLSGEELVAKAIQIARNPIFQADEIKLCDASEISLREGHYNCYFSLYILKILSSGQSWYNQYGFFYNVESEDADIYEKNNAIRGMTCNNLLDIISQNTDLGNDILEMKNTLIFEANKNRLVEDLAKKIEKTFKNPRVNCDDPVVQWYLKFLQVVQYSRIISYKNCLTYKFPYSRGGRKTKNAKTKKSKNKNKSIKKNS